MKFFLLIAFCATLLFGCSGPCKNCGCDNVDDCLSKYKFEEARKFAVNIGHGWFDIRYYVESKEYWDHKRIPVMSKIIVSEVNYWISHNELKRAEDITKEILIIDCDEASFPGNCRELKQKYLELNLEIIKKYCELGETEEGKKLAKRLPQKTCDEAMKILKTCK